MAAAATAPNTMSGFRTLDHVDVKGKRVLMRVDLNVPVEAGVVTDATRIERAGPAITEIADKGGKVILLSHFGRPKGRDPKYSLKPVAAEVARIIKRRVGFADDCIGEVAERAVAAMKPGDIICLENTRFHAGEEKNDPAFVAALAGSAIFGSTMLSLLRIVPMHQLKVSVTNCRPTQDAPCRPSSMR